MYQENIFFHQSTLHATRWCPMGGSISPTLANIFLCHHEENWIDNYPPEVKPIFYRRYVDNTFVLINNPLQIQQFLQYLNNQHSRMKFTLKSERNNAIAFSNINIVKHDDSFATNLYRKLRSRVLVVNMQ